MKQAPDATYIITTTPARAEEIRQAIVLRGFDEIVCVPVENAPQLLRVNPPALAIWDLESDWEKLLALMSEVPPQSKNLVLADAFDETAFLACHDAGVRDFMVKPVPDAYLVSRIISTLQEYRREQIAEQKDRVLVDMGVLAARSGVFTTSYLLKLLKQAAEENSSEVADSLALLVVGLSDAHGSLPDSLQNALMAKLGNVLKECARGEDMVGEYFLDKCLVILPQTGKRGAAALGKRVLEKLKGLTFKGESGVINLEARVGIADYAGCRNYEDLVNQALDNLKSETSKALSPMRPV